MTNTRILLWLIPILTTVHNLEEALFMPAVIERRNSSIPDFLRGLLPPITYEQFLLALFIMTAIPYLVAWAANMERERGPRFHLLLCWQVMMLINVFAHAIMAVMIGGYAPGVVTAIAFNLPFSIYLLRRAMRDRWVSKRAMMLFGPIGLALHGLGLPGIIILSRKIVHGL